MKRHGTFLLWGHKFDADEWGSLQVIDEDRIAAETDEAVLMLAALEGELEAVNHKHLGLPVDIC